MSNNFRSRSVCITASIHEQLKAYSDLHNLSCPDEAACLLLGERLSAEPGFEFINKLYRKTLDQYRVEAAAMLRKQQPDDTDTIPL